MNEASPFLLLLTNVCVFQSKNKTDHLPVCLCRNQLISLSALWLAMFIGLALLHACEIAITTVCTLLETFVRKNWCVCACSMDPSPDTHFHTFNPSVLLFPTHKNFSSIPGKSAKLPKKKKNRANHAVSSKHSTRILLAS